MNFQTKYNIIKEQTYNLFVDNLRLTSLLDASEFIFFNLRFKRLFNIRYLNIN